MMRSGKLFVFDLDDTLLYNKHNYSGPMLETVELILNTLGHKAPYMPAIVAMINDIDTRRVKEIDPTTGKQYRYNRRRFPGSLVAAYEKVCTDNGVPAKKDVKEKLLAIGEKAFAPEQYLRNIVPDTQPVLAFLAGQGDLLVLRTKGDKEIQEDKLAVLSQQRILPYFSSVKIVDQKDSDTFAEVLESQQKCSGGAYSVGNMFQGDIAPALAVGYKGVYIPDEHWETQGDKEKSLREIDPTKVLVLDSLGQLIDRYGDLP